ncbi:MAG: hypothetical protein IPK82_16840 [Polyangiaceae bacterium]|nr:hypothetical protein [Polyangiaceae bacterium]
MAQHVSSFEQSAEAAIRSLGGSDRVQAVDGSTDPARASEALSTLAEKACVLLRASLDSGATEPGFAPVPLSPYWIKVTRGSAEIQAVSAVGNGETKPVTRKVGRVIMEQAPVPESEVGTITRVVLSLDKGGDALGSNVTVAEVWTAEDVTGANRLRTLASRLARVLAVPASLPNNLPTTESELNDKTLPEVSPGALSRFVLRAEGPRLVLRDFANTGPRENLSTHVLIGLVFACAAGTSWYFFANTRASLTALSAPYIAWIAGSAILTLAAVAFLGVAQFAGRYSATSAPLVAFGGGKLVVQPWVSRKGAVGLDLEGRFGAAIDLVEVQSITVEDRKGKHAVEVKTDHGPFDALVTDDHALAEMVAGALARTLSDLRPKVSRPTAKQRARLRAATAQ